MFELVFKKRLLHQDRPSTARMPQWFAPQNQARPDTQLNGPRRTNRGVPPIAPTSTVPANCTSWRFLAFRFWEKLCLPVGYMVKWRRDRDSNPGSACTDNGFRDRRIRPLCHLSAVVVAWVLAKPPPGGKGQKHCNLIGGNPRCKLQNHLYRTRVSVALVR